MKFYIIFFVSFEKVLTQEIWKEPWKKNLGKKILEKNLHEHEELSLIESSGDSSFQPAVASTRIASTPPCKQGCKKFETTIESLIEKYKFSLYNPFLAIVRDMGVLGADII